MPETVHIGQFVLGAVLLLVAIAGGQIELFGASVQAAVSNRYIRLLVGAMGLFFLLPTILAILREVLPAPTTPATPTMVAIVTPTSPPATVPPTAAPTAAPKAPPPTAAPAAVPTASKPAATPIASGCVLTIRNPLVQLKRDPNPSTPNVGPARPGQYHRKEYRVANWAGASLGWFLIGADGRSGWIEDDSINIEAKTAPCPPEPASTSRRSSWSRRRSPARTWKR